MDHLGAYVLGILTGGLLVTLGIAMGWHYFKNALGNAWRAK